MGPDQLIFSGILPWDGQMWCLAQSDFKGKQIRLQEKLWSRARFCINKQKNCKVYVELTVKLGVPLNIF